METSYMLDTNMASFVIKGNFPAVRKRLLSVPIAQICISVITEAELLFGVARRPDAQQLKIAVDEFCLRVEILPWDSKAAHCYADLRALLERSGKLLGNMDMMIAAHALSSKAMLISHDKAFQNVHGLKLADWTRN